MLIFLGNGAGDDETDRLSVSSSQNTSKCVI